MAVIVYDITNRARYGRGDYLRFLSVFIYIFVYNGNFLVLGMRRRFLRGGNGGLAGLCWVGMII